LACNYSTRQTNVLAPNEKQRSLNAQQPDPQPMRHESITGGARESWRRFEALWAYPKSMREKFGAGGFRFSPPRCPRYSVRRASSNKWFKSLASLTGTG